MPNPYITIRNFGIAAGALAGLQIRLHKRVERTTKALRVKQSFLLAPEASAESAGSSACETTGFPLLAT